MIKQHFGISFIFAAIALLFAVSNNSFASPVIRSASGANAAAIQATVDTFRNDIGGANNGVGGSFTSGRREINWDGVPDANAAPNFFPANFFNSNSPRGAIFTSPASNAGNDTQNFIVSSTTASGVPVRFGNIDASYSTIFQTFSAQRLFTVRSSTDNSTVLGIQFFIPGTNIPATVSGFGVVFCDVDSNINAIMRVYGTDGRLLTTPVSAQASNNGLTFIGVSFNAGERIARVEILSGNKPLVAGNIDGTNGVDVIAMDDFIYGEPRAMQYHSSDFDGDGTSDYAVFRPSNGTWFILNSGTNTLSTIPFGLNGDIPIDGDFDGDQRADAAIYRPSNGVWFFLRSSNGTTLGATFGGVAGDKPVPADYDKDGKTDIAFWRPSSGTYFVLRSSDNFGTFFGAPWGANGDIPIQTAGQ